MFIKKFYRNFVKSLMALKSSSRIRLKKFVVVMTDNLVISGEVTLFMNGYGNF